jgi:hypothetical protein
MGEQENIATFRQLNSHSRSYVAVVDLITLFDARVATGRPKNESD